MIGPSPSATGSIHDSATRLSGPLANLWRRLGSDRAIILGVVAILTAVCWSNLIFASASMAEGGSHAHAVTQPFLLTSAMWVLMMIGMMAPSVSPFLTTFAAMARRRRSGVHPVLLTALFFLGYCLVWTIFSAIAAAIQIALQAASLLSHVSMSLTPVAGGVVLISAGAFQWTPAKDACLRSCRSPLGFLISEWREGAFGACAMGLHHGLFCLGCCLLIMLLPFAAGVMNLSWMVGITIFILLEKVAPRGEIVARMGGFLLALYGASLIWRALI